jgi:hypothetical protein
VEAAGSLEVFLPAYLKHIADYGYDDAPYELDARAHELRVELTHSGGRMRSGQSFLTAGTQMKEPGVDARYRDNAAPKTGEIQQKRGDTLNKN